MTYKLRFFADFCLALTASQTLIRGSLGWHTFFCTPLKWLDLWSPSLKSSEVIESKERDENTILDYDEAGKLVSISVEHASERADLEHLSLSGIAA